MNSLKKYTKEDINLFLNGDNLIDGVNSSLKEFINNYYNNDALSKKSQKIYLGRISDNLSLKIDNVLNSSKRFDKTFITKDSNVVISSDNLRHIFKEHSKERHKGQINVNAKHLNDVALVISNPDYIGLSNQLSRGKTPTLIFTKKINGYSVAITVLSTKKQLYLQTYYVFSSDSKEYFNYIKNNKLKKAEDVEPNDMISLGFNV